MNSDTEVPQMTLIKKFIALFKCDTARISRPLDRGRMFLIIGWNRNTKDNKTGYWERNGERYDFDYVDEQCIASGQTTKELIADARWYHSLRGLSMLDIYEGKTQRARSVRRRWNARHGSYFPLPKSVSLNQGRSVGDNKGSAA